MSSVGVGVVGAGPWGVRVARAFARTRGADLRWICDLDADRLARAGAGHPGARLTRDLDELLADRQVDAVAVAVDAPAHHAVARRALAAGRHVLVEKPMALSLAASADLCALAEARGRLLMVGHVLLHHPAVLRAREIIAAGGLGRVLYLQATRVAFGTVRAGESAWWSVAPHDLAVALYLFGGVPATVSATGAAYLQPGLPDVAFASLRFADGRLAHVHVSWLAPARHRALTVVGTDRMLTFDEGAAERPLRIHDRGFAPASDGGGWRPRSGADGDGAVEAPALPSVEPLAAECAHFVDCVATGARPRGDGREAMAVMRVLDAGERSMQAGGAAVEVT
jgi:predicted dehydrogenase